MALPAWLRPGNSVLRTPRRHRRRHAFCSPGPGKAQGTYIRKSSRSWPSRPARTAAGSPLCRIPLPRPRGHRR